MKFLRNKNFGFSKIGILGIVLMVLIIIGGVFIVKKYREGKTESPERKSVVVEKESKIPENQQEKEKTEIWKVYENKQLGISFKYLADWKMDVSTSKEERFFISFSHQGEGGTSGLFTLEYRGEKDMLEKFKKVQAMFHSKIGKVEETEIDGVVASKGFEMEQTDNAQKVTLTYVFPHKEKEGAFLITLTAIDSKKNPYHKRILEEMVDSFKFIK